MVVKKEIETVALDYYDKLQKKKKALDKILDFVAFPTKYPITKYTQIGAYIDALWDNGEISAPHFFFLKRVLGIEYAMVTQHIKELEGKA